MGICYITRREQREEVNDQLGIYCAGNDARPVEEVYVPDKVIVLATRVFQNDKYVTTHSEGEEPFRRVVVTLKKQSAIRNDV